MSIDLITLYSNLANLNIDRNIFRRLHCAGFVSLLVSAAVSLGEFSLLEPGNVINLHMTSLLLPVIFAAATRILVSQHQVKLVQHPGYHLDRIHYILIGRDTVL